MHNSKALWNKYQVILKALSVSKQKKFVHMFIVQCIMIIDNFTIRIERNYHGKLDIQQMSKSKYE